MRVKANLLELFDDIRTSTRRPSKTHDQMSKSTQLLLQHLSNSIIANHTIHAHEFLYNFYRRCTILAYIVHLLNAHLSQYILLVVNASSVVGILHQLRVKI